MQVFRSGCYRYFTLNHYKSIVDTVCLLKGFLRLSERYHRASWVGIMIDLAFAYYFDKDFSV